MKRAQRMTGLDLARVAALFLVILQHSWSMPGFDGKPGLPHSIYSCLVEMNVPLFIAISGFFQIGHEMPVGHYLKNRLSRLLVPFLIWSVPVFAISLASGKYEIDGFGLDSIAYYITYLFSGKINTAYWFVYLIFGLYMVTPVLHAVKKYHAGILAFCIPLMLVFSVYRDIHMSSPFFDDFPVSFTYLGYYIAGYVIICQLNKCDTKKPFNIAAAVIFIASTAIDIVLKQNGAGRNGTLVIFKTLSLLTLLSSVQTLPDRMTILLERTSNYSYLIYLTHFVLVGAICATFSGFIEGLNVAPMFISVAVMVAEYAMCRIMATIRFLPHKHLGLIVHEKDK